MSIKLSVIMPAIRTHQWPNVYKSLRKSCKKHTVELIACGPFAPPDEMLFYPGFYWHQSYARPSVCAQLAACESRGEYIFLTCDDGTFDENTIDNALELIEDKAANDFITMRYREGGNTQALNTWNAHFYGEFRRSPWVAVDYKIAVQFLCRYSTFRGLGGFNCEYEYLNGGAHDFVFRLQQAGGYGYISRDEIANFDHMPERTGDHGPIHDCCVGADKDLFEKIWYGGERPKSHIDFYNYKQFLQDWERRFPKRYTSYQEMMDNR